MIVNIPMVCMKGAGAMARNKYPEETVARILDVSLKLFLEKGYENTTIQTSSMRLEICPKEPFITISSLSGGHSGGSVRPEAVCRVEALMNEVVTDKRLNGRGKTYPYVYGAPEHGAG